MTDETPSPPQKTGRNGRLIRGLCALIGILVIVVAALAGYTIGHRNDHTHTPTTALDQTRTSTTVQDAAERLTLRQTLEQMVKQGDDVAKRGASDTDGWKFLDHYAVPGCAAFMRSLATAFGTSDDTSEPDSPTTVVSVVETGDHGVTVTQAPHQWRRRDDRLLKR
ncbi:hypothetical protein GCM10027169_24330 [Gordonia jinhuaensis]|uniref:Uncharacterized protein n=2 Tax=Gordonia jinhuaensis TaxID=1517702 RepID=A0A916TC75_9ACTN|nr:hypothetical protein GCM10011489_29210 [Gordonia jinhuaensis]